MLEKKGKHYYSNTAEDIPECLKVYSKTNTYVATEFAKAICRCGASIFELHTDEKEGVAGRVCIACGQDHVMCDGEAYLADAELGQHECLCGKNHFEITVGVALYDQSQAVRWLYIGCRCITCGLTGCYADWKNEHEDVRQLLLNV
jgi:hypothetical protein